MATSTLLRLEYAPHKNSARW